MVDKINQMVAPINGNIAKLETEIAELNGKLK